MAIGIFGGSFDPVHTQHVEYAQAAIEYLNLRRLFVLPSYVAPHKRSGARASAEERLKLCRLAFESYPQIEVSDYEIAQGGTSYSYLTCKHFKQLFPEEEVYFLVGADMLEDFFTWRNPDELLSYCTLAACGRGNMGTEALKKRFFERFGCLFQEIPFTGEEVSSTRIRVDIAFQRYENLPQAVADELKRTGLYQFPDLISEAFRWMKLSRAEHTYRVACMAAARARSVGVSEEQALIACILHDSAKYLPPDSPYLAGFESPKGVPTPVLHQFTGAYLAKTRFHIEDEEILNAIRFHTSGREGMNTLEMLVFLADMLEEGRDFPHVEELRALFWQDLEACMEAALSHQIEYLKGSGKEVYPLTQAAYEDIKNRRIKE